MMREKISSVISISIILVVIIVLLITLIDSGSSARAQGQGNLTIGNQTITPQQRAVICDPNNPKLNFVNTTESKICGIPKTITNTTAPNMTTGAQSPPSTTSI